MSLFLNTVSLITVLATSLALSNTGRADSDPKTPMPFQKPLYWGNLPPPTALVHLQTSIGAFTLPMGYLQNWFALRDQPVATAPDGARQFSGGLYFQFEYPSGGMSSNYP